jgi:hypothetical protein
MSEIKTTTDQELKQALTIMELEERFELTAASADALRCGDNSGCTITQSAAKASA